MVSCRRPVDALMTTVAEGATLVRHLRFLVEELSMKDFLHNFLPRFLPEGFEFQITAFRGKHDLLKNLPNRLAGLSKWLSSEQRIFVLVDRDSDDCHDLKDRLEAIAKKAGLTTRTSTSSREWQIVNRIVIEELEAWYFGDWEAVRSAFYNAPKDPSKRERYRDPDDIRGGTWEAFQRVMKSEFPDVLRKREVACRIGERIDPSRSKSRSFKIFYDAVLEAAA